MHSPISIFSPGGHSFDGLGLGGGGDVGGAGSSSASSRVATAQMSVLASPELDVACGLRA